MAQRYRLGGGHHVWGSSGGSAWWLYVFVALTLVGVCGAQGAQVDRDDPPTTTTAVE